MRSTLTILELDYYILFLYLFLLINNFIVFLSQLILTSYLYFTLHGLESDISLAPRYGCHTSNIQDI